MISIKEIYDQTLLCENNKIHHLFDSGDLTFADIRDVFSKIFVGDIVFSKKTNGKSLFITYKDGKFRVSGDENDVQDQIDYDDVDAKYCGAEEIGGAVSNTLRDLRAALGGLTDVDLNRYFANGQNFLACRVVFPPFDRIGDYGNKCPVSFSGIKCYNDKFKEVGEDSDQFAELRKTLTAGPDLADETRELDPATAEQLKNMVSSRAALAKILEQLGKFIDGVGWKCSLNQYVQDRYSRHIVNKALEHGIDVSRTSDFVNALSQRLSQVSGKKPTKSDLVTYAKCDGVNYHDPEYAAFVQELESNCDRTNAEIIKPIEDLISEAIGVLSNNVACFMSSDPSKCAARARQQLRGDISDGADTVAEGESAGLTRDRVRGIRKTLQKLDEYLQARSPDGIVVMYRGQPYGMTGNWGDIGELACILNYK